ncbi:MAG: ATP-dependent DNA helicase [Haloferacaceae archaeon]
MSSDSDWRTVFGHAEPYADQEDGVEAALSAAREGGFAVIEGACGTGKTMLALSAGLSLVRDPDSEYERVVVLTSVRQQLRQFEADLDRINANLPDDWRPFSGLTLVGKADVCPYSRERAGNVEPATVYERCDGLRERTRDLTGEGGETTAATLARDARSAQTGLADSGSSGSGSGSGVTYLETAGEPTPYLPETGEYDGTEYCPFYARYLADRPADGDPVEAVPFDPGEHGHLDHEDLVALAAGHGSCPHSIMGALLPHVEVVVGNYYHAFDPTTSGAFTGALLDDETFVVCDEAHMLESRVRDLVSGGVADATLRDAESELTRTIQPLAMADPDRTGEGVAAIRAEVDDADVGLDDLRRTRALIRDLREELDRRVRAHLDRAEPDWRDAPGRLDGAEIPLRDPAEPGPDAITEWAHDAGHDEGVWVRAEAVGAVVERALDAAAEASGDADADRRYAAPAAGRALAAWIRCDHERYFREIELSRSGSGAAAARADDDAWRRLYDARLVLHNCVPGDAIAEVLGEFGGGVLMSATLEPLDVFREVTGLDRLADAGRPVVERTYGLSFPEAHRASFAVDAPAFTHENRGPPGAENETRRVHADAAASVAAGPGNVLVGMPNYAEAEWMAGALEERVEKPVLLDESSADRVTEALKAEFFDGPGKVLVTSLRGTLTEGVDYRGDRLRAAVVCGVPIIDTSSPRTRAVVEAYDRTFGDGFETALVVPSVRKARQALGRVIRGPDERGVRALVDERYARDVWNGVRTHLPPHERAEFTPTTPDMLDLGLDRFRSRDDDDPAA